MKKLGWLLPILALFAFGASPARAVVGICSFNTPSCAPTTCCAGTYSVSLYNTGTSDVSTVVRLKVWTCTAMSESCSSLPTGTPTVYCFNHTIPANTSCSSPDTLTLLSGYTPPCTCSGQRGTGTAIFQVEILTGCTGYTLPTDCLGLDTFCSAIADSACARKDNQLCILINGHLECCCN